MRAIALPRFLDLRPRFARWIRRRQGEDELPVDIHRRRLYVLPTRGGILFGIGLLFMLVAGLNYANGVALFLTFLLAGLALVAMHRAHRNLLGLELLQILPVAAFAGETASLQCVLRNPARFMRYSVEISRGTRERALADLAPQGSATAALPIMTRRRGVLRIDRLRIATRFPFGIFEAWTYVHRTLEIEVYPRAFGARPPPPAPGGDALERSALAAGDEEWLGLRAFRDGDSPRQVDWKAYARGSPLLVKEYGSLRGRPRIFDFETLSGLDAEARLSQLCRWILDAEAHGNAYGLRLPHTEVPSARGRQHLERCLSALARHGTDHLVRGGTA
jgi:uncharacterized protein (DUF58 family)